MKLIEILNKIDLNDQELSVFTDDVITPLTINKHNKIIELEITTTSPLSFSVFIKLKQKLSSKLDNFNIKLFVRTNENGVSVADVQEYFSYYLRQVKKIDLDNHVLINMNQDVISILTHQSDNVEVITPHIDDFTVFLNDIGIIKTVEVITSTPNIDIKTDVAQHKEVERPLFEKKEYKPYGGSGYEKLTLSEITDAHSKVEITGEVFKVDDFTTRSGMTIQTIMISDQSDAFICKRFEGKRFSLDDLNELKKGNYVIIRGNVQYDRFSNDIVVIINQLAIVDNPKRVTDGADVKRVELHAHTNRSEMDGIPEATDLVKYAYDLGHPAVAITDHMVIQGFPDAYNTLRSIRKQKGARDFKVLYGVEFNTVNDDIKIVTNVPNNNLLDDTYVIFDIETTGLSNHYDEIIEFGAVKITNNTVVDRLQMFINPKCVLSDFTRQLTGIQQADVDQAEDIDGAILKILEFFAQHPIVAHNANFDIDFIQAKMDQLGMAKLSNPIIDTLMLSRALHRERRSHRLGNVARYYGVSYDEDIAHRADYDAEVTSKVFINMLQELKAIDISSYQQVQNLIDNEFIIKSFATHINVLIKNQAGVKDLYKLITLSHTDYLAIINNVSKEDSKDVVAEPRIPKNILTQHRENLLFGSSCQNGELFEIAMNKSQAELERVIDFYDYIEVMAPENYRNLVDRQVIPSMDRVKDILKRIIVTAKAVGKIVVATGDVHYLTPEDKIYRDIYINAQGIGGTRHPLYVYNKTNRMNTIAPNQHFRTTNEMLTAFDFIDEDLAYEIVVTNSNRIADSIDDVAPLKKDLYTPVIPDAEDSLVKLCYDNARRFYGDDLPQLVEERLNIELDSITKHGFSVVYYISYLLVKRSMEDGYIVGSRGSVGSSFVATMANITEVNPLPPHYRCPSCKNAEFFLDGSVSSGYDLPNKKCPKCDVEMIVDGQDIPFETFLGFEGDKVPDIDLNFSGDYQERAHAFTKEIFGDEYVYKAGTIGTVAAKTAYGYVLGYTEEKELPDMRNAQKERLAAGAEGVKRTTGQHPGGIIVIPSTMDVHDFTPVQYPANNVFSEWKTTHFQYGDIEDNVLKLDILGHQDPTAMKLLSRISGIDVLSIPMNDPKVMSIFNSLDAMNIDDRYYTESTGAAGLPEFGTQFVRRMLEVTKPNSFSDLLRISGLSHGTDVWANNAELLINEGMTLNDVIGCRDDIMVYLIQKGLTAKDSFDIMESVRKGRGLTDTFEKLMRDNNVPEWYIDSCLKIKYMFPKAHAVAYVIMAVRVAWFKVYYPHYYYVSYFTVRANAHEIETMVAGKDAIERRLADIKNRLANRETAYLVTSKEREIMNSLEVAYEMQLRGYKFSNIDINRSLADEFLVDENDDKIIIPPFTAIDGLGVNVGKSIVIAREEHPFISKEDIVKRTQVSSAMIKKFDELKALDHLQAENQLSLF